MGAKAGGEVPTGRGRRIVSALLSLEIHRNPIVERARRSATHTPKSLLIGACTGSAGR
jgi:hypothetical protein